MNCSGNRSYRSSVGGMEYCRCFYPSNPLSHYCCACNTVQFVKLFCSPAVTVTCLLPVRVRTSEQTSMSNNCVLCNLISLFFFWCFRVFCFLLSLAPPPYIVPLKKKKKFSLICFSCAFCAFCFPGEHVDLGSRGREGATGRSARRGRQFRALHPGAQPRRERLLVGWVVLARVFMVIGAT